MKTLHIPPRRSERPSEGFSWGTASQLPLEMMQQARERLGSVAVFLGVFELLVLGGVVYGPIPDQFEPRFLALNLWSLGLQCAVSLLVALVCLAKWVPERWVLTLGLVYEVLVCWLTSVGMIRASLVTFGHAPIMTWTTPIIILFPLLIPSPPLRMLIAALAAAATSPAAVLYLDFKGEMVAGAGDIVLAIASPLVAVMIAGFGAHIIYGIGRAIATAQDMGSYRLDKPLGEGGMGEVWRASHRMLARPAAVKLIRPEVLGATDEHARAALDRFEREAQVTANLRSSHTVDLYDFGRTDDGTFYYVMELLDGLDLDTLVARYGPIPAERAVFLLRQVCHSLDEAHANDLVHRDIKPANAFVCRHGRDYDFIKVLDFGLVKAQQPADGNGGDPVKLTAQNAVIGTPAFMAPEMAIGGLVDHRADLYAVGCLAFWLLSGRLVFEGTTPMAIAVSHASKVPPSVASVSEEPPPKELDALITRCLSKDPNDRPQSAAELSRDLDAVPLTHPWGLDRAEQWWRMHNPETTAS